MKVSPLVSIIIPTYNDSSVICDAIDCSLHQTYKNVEIIVIDDGSSDSTGQMLKEKYGDQIKYFYQDNKGLSNARNNGIRHSSGKYLQFLDADDIIDHIKISAQVERLKDSAEISLAYSDYHISPIDGSTIKYARMSPVLQKEKPFDDIMMKWETELSIPIHCFMFDAVFFKKYGIFFDESLHSHEDWECWMNVFALNPTVIFIDTPLANYRIRTKSMCTNKRKMRDGYLLAINKQIQKNRSNKEVVKKLKTRKKQIKYLYKSVGPLMRIMEMCHPNLKKIYSEITPWRIQRMLD